jgi:hypothetical protein
MGATSPSHPKGEDDPFEILVQSAGNPIVNGLYRRQGMWQGAFKYSKEGRHTHNGVEHELCIVLCRLSNNNASWFISAVQLGHDTGSTIYIDYYRSHHVALDNFRIPPREGWNTAEHGMYPLPRFALFFSPGDGRIEEQKWKFMQSDALESTASPLYSHSSQETEYPIGIVVEGTGKAIVNGVYHRRGIWNGAFKYVQDVRHTHKGVDHVLCIVLCRLVSGSPCWFISAVQVESDPGTAVYIDYFRSHPIAVDSSPIIPPTEGWIKDANGIQPLHHLSFLSRKKNISPAVMFD